MLIQNFLPTTCLTYITDKLNNETKWSKGPLTGNTSNSLFKHNKEYIGEDKKELDNLIIAALNNCISWRSYVTAPKATSEILYLKYDKDSLYKYHADVSKGLLLGAIHYANTLFLNEPEEYEGGELVLTINQEAIPYKLKKNTLLTYPVGLKHSVNTITKGTRKVAVFWTESYITNNEDRETIRELEAMSNNLLKVLNDKNKSIKVKNQNIKDTLIDLARVSELVQSKYPRLRDPLCPLISD